MKTALIITTFNRPEYLKLCFESLQRADLSKIGFILIVDDNSTNAKTIQLIEEFKMPPFISVYRKTENKSIKDSLLYGFNYLFESGFDTVINLDGDAIVRNDFVDRLLDLKLKYPELIVTGFNCNTKNRDGSIRHKHLYSEPGATFRASVGGINMCVGRVQYLKWIKPALLQSYNHGGNWDHLSCINSAADSCPIAVTVPSVIQHLGVNSSMGHDAGGEPADTADDFKFLGLTNVSLIGIADDVEGLIYAAKISTSDIHFGDVKILSYKVLEESKNGVNFYPNHLRNNKKSDISVIQINPLGSKIAYSKFLFNDLFYYINTEFILVFQYDGFILNWKAWNPEFFKYDYIGALWNFYDDNHKCGNGGFSFRSKRLHQILKEDKSLVLRNDATIKNFAEDHNICRIYRTYLENNYGIKFAPDEICEQFSIEAWGVMPPGNKYKGSLGFHGFSVDFRNVQLPYIPYLLPNPKKQIY